MPIYPVTHKSLIQRACEPVPTAARAREELCEIYRPCVIRYLRVLAVDRSIHEDVAQDVFVALLESPVLRIPGHLTGSFSAYVREIVHSVLRARAKYLSRQKRGGGVVVESLDEHPELLDSVPSLDSVFDEICARIHFDQATAALAKRYSGDRALLYELLWPFVVGKLDSADIPAVALRLKKSERAVEEAIRRMRKKWNEELLELATKLVGPERAKEEASRWARAQVDPDPSPE